MKRTKIIKIKPMNKQKKSIVFTEEKLRKYWASEKSITYRGKKYRVGKMSYGDYFLEPVMTEKEKKRYYGEIKPFHPRTLWLEKKATKNNQVVYEVESDLK